MYAFRCANVENGCDWDEIADSKSELMIYIKEHFEEEHGMKKFPVSLEQKAKTLIEEFDDDDLDDYYDDYYY